MVMLMVMMTKMAEMQKCRNGDGDGDPPALPDPPAHILGHTQPAAFQHACLSQHLVIGISLMNAP